MLIADLNRQRNRPEDIEGEGPFERRGFDIQLRTIAVDSHQLTGIDPETVVATDEERAQVRGRSIVVKRLKPLPLEAVARSA